MISGPDPAWPGCGPSFSPGWARSCGGGKDQGCGMKPTNIAYPRKHSIVANENYENYQSTSGNGTIGIYHNNNNLTISKLSIDFIMIISPAMPLAVICNTFKNDKEKDKKNENQVKTMSKCQNVTEFQPQ